MFLNEQRFDFSQESDLKGRLWEKMEQKMNSAASSRDEVSLSDISPIPAQKNAPPTSNNNTKSTPKPTVPKR